MQHRRVRMLLGGVVALVQDDEVQVGQLRGALLRAHAHWKKRRLVGVRRGVAPGCATAPGCAAGCAAVGVGLGVGRWVWALGVGVGCGCWAWGFGRGAG
eukprot:222559-Chlamydomonas_euryale.AAC.1